MGWASSLLDAASSPFPRWHSKRLSYRMQAKVLQTSLDRPTVEASIGGKHFDGASKGRRTDGWHTISADADSGIGPALDQLRAVSRWMMDNNGVARSAIRAICDDVIGAKGLKPCVASPIFDEWSRDPAYIDADGIHNFAGLQYLVMQTVALSGSALVRKVWEEDDRSPLPLKLRVLEPDFLDRTKDGRFPNGQYIQEGVQFDSTGKRVGFWMYREHPGATYSARGSIYDPSEFVPRNEVLHVFRCERPGQTVGFPWIAPVMAMMYDFLTFADASLVKQQIAASMAAYIINPESGSSSLGKPSDFPGNNKIKPGTITPLPPGSTLDVVQPPRSNDYEAFVTTTLRQIAAGIGVTYEDMTGDYSNASFSHSKLSRMRHWSRIERWREQMIVPQFCQPVFEAAMLAARLTNRRATTNCEWIGAGLPIVEPDKQARADALDIRAGFSTLSDKLRERGKDPATHLDDYAADLEAISDRELIVDIDVRSVTQQGQLQGDAAADSRIKETEAEAELAPDPVEEDDADVSEEDDTTSDEEDAPPF